MRGQYSPGRRPACRMTGLLSLALLMGFALPLRAGGMSGEELYRDLSSVTKSPSTLFEELNTGSRELDWSRAEEMSFEGNLRLLKMEDIDGTDEEVNLFFIRKLTGEIFILSIPEKSDDRYLDLEEMTKNKLVFKIEVKESAVRGVVYKFARFVDKPFQGLFDKLFKISIVFLLFFVMVGMGMTLAVKDFALVFKKPRGIIIGQILQFGLMPLLALALGYLLGFYERYPYIYVGMILVTVNPGGVISNLMTHFAKGDLALSISLNSFSTVLALVLTPLLLALYCSNVPDVTIPVVLVLQTITVLVIAPLVVGMLVRFKWLNFAEKATPYFSALGIVSVLFVIVSGVLTNLDKLFDIERYGPRLYLAVFVLTLGGMFFGAAIPKLFGVSNYQCRAISMETGLRNSILAMTLAILIQDQMGDFHSSMFAVSGMFGIEMYVAGAIAIFLFKRLLPVEG